MTEPHRRDPDRLPPLWFPWPPHLGEVRRAIVRKGPDIPESSSRGQQEPPVAPPTGFAIWAPLLLAPTALILLETERWAVSQGSGHPVSCGPKAEASGVSPSVISQTV